MSSQDAAEPTSARTQEYLVTLRYGRYGFPNVEPIRDANLRIALRGNTFSIAGNPQGLLCLAQHLIGLANMEYSPEKEGYHIHVEEECGLDADGQELILYVDSPSS